MKRPLWRLGVGLAGLYALAVASTGLVSHRPVRPLFNAVGGAIPYKWVNAGTTHEPVTWRCQPNSSPAARSRGRTHNP